MSDIQPGEAPPGSARPMRICVVKAGGLALTETFIRAHVDLLPGEVTFICGSPPCFAHDPSSRAPLWRQMLDRAYHLQRGRPDHEKYRAAYTRLLSRKRPDAVLAEYGPTAVRVLESARQLGIPLIAHFHGYDASKHEVLREYEEGYNNLFGYAAAVVGSSQPMCDSLIGMGAPPERVHHNPYGVDIQEFAPGNPDQAPPTFLAIGRLVEKKAPHLLLLAFAQARRQVPDAKLRVIGGGPLVGVCKDLVVGLGLEGAVELLGPQPHDVVRREMAGCRAFVQHSVVAESGDSEGTPVGVMEAGAAGLPVISTRHAGIPHVVEENRTGFLVEERDVEGMSQAMVRLAEDPELARSLGAAARRRVEEHFSMDGSIHRLGKIIEQAVAVPPDPSRSQPPLPRLRSPALRSMATLWQRGRSP
jgi:colanic acid/amylovoran biosynthesis glycosyltransferase